MEDKIQEMFDNIMCGNSSYITGEYVRTLNEEAMRIFDHRDQQLSYSEIAELREIIMICNVVYNRTDITVQVIEDGFYDLLLELYKKYDEHFQVGSAVVEFKDMVNHDIDDPRKVAEPAIVFHDVVERDDLHQSIYERLNDVPAPTRADFVEPGIIFDPVYINKRVHNSEHNHPTLVGTLDKCKFVFNSDAIEAGVFADSTVKILERDFFQKHVDDGIIDPNGIIKVICELKYDGISVEADCTERVVSARTRGDTGVGKAADITPILEGYRFKHGNPMMGETPIGVKFEAIMTKSNLYTFNSLRGRSYVNCRSAIVGLFGASDASFYRDLITLVPLAIDRDNVPSISTRMEEIMFMNELFRNEEPLRYCYFEGSLPEVLYLIKSFHDEALLARDYLDFMFDGIVVSYADEETRNKLGRKNFINKYSMAVKFQPLLKQTTFLGYTYEVGQQGRITPMIHYNPVEFFGTIHNQSSGASLGRFRELGLKVGDYINVTYNNDVMPYVSRLDCTHNRENPNPVVKFPTHCPCCGTELVISETGKDCTCPNYECGARTLARMVNMFQKLNLKGFAEASIEVLSIKHLYEIANLTEDVLIQKLGEADGKKFSSIILSILQDPWYDYVVMAALGFSGLATKKWQAILQKTTVQELYEQYTNNPGEFRFWLVEKLGQSSGRKTIEVLVKEFPYFAEDIKFILANVHLVASTIKEDALQIRFTGLRRPELVDLLIKYGIDASDGGVTSKTKVLIVPYTGFDSVKVQKAEKYGAMITPIDDFIRDVKYYTGLDIDISNYS